MRGFLLFAIWLGLTIVSVGACEDDSSYKTGPASMSAPGNDAAGNGGADQDAGQD